MPKKSLFEGTRKYPRGSMANHTIPELSPFPKARENAADQLASPLLKSATISNWGDQETFFS
jgi:hypothetical protein